MADLVWKSEYSIGNYQLDHEHQQLMALADKVMRFAGADESHAAVETALKALDNYTRIHFRNEEKYMRRIGYAGLEHHRRCHSELIARLTRVGDAISSRDDLVHQLKRLMVVWVIDHIATEDKKIPVG